MIYLFILLASSRRFPLDYVFETLSLPARSTIFSIPLRYFVSPASFQRWRTVIWITAWLLEDLLFWVKRYLLLLSLQFFWYELLSWHWQIVLHQSSLKFQWGLWHGCLLPNFPWSLISYESLPADHRHNPDKTKQSWLWQQIASNSIFSW